MMRQMAAQPHPDMHSLPFWNRIGLSHPCSRRIRELVAAMISPAKQEIPNPTLTISIWDFEQSEDEKV